jgi:dTDP-4-amino-4,6-dideoxygalactose transaminase
MAALLLDLQPGDEVIMPSFTFVSTANAFVLRGATIKFADSYPDQPNVDPDSIAELIGPRTKAIVPVHYAGVACDMDAIAALISGKDIAIVEDAAQAVDSYYKGRALGSIGALAAFSFHETKNVISGEGGMLAVNDDRFAARAEIIWEKGTNRSAFFRGEVDKYGWVDVGSSFLPSEVTAAFLYAQLEELDRIQGRRKDLWQTYFDRLLPHADEGRLLMPVIPDYASNNAHMFYVVLPDIEVRTALIKFLRKRGILAVFHYQSLHASKFYRDRHGDRPLPQSDRYTECLLRLPLFCDLTDDEHARVCDVIDEFFRQ